MADKKEPEKVFTKKDAEEEAAKAREHSEGQEHP